MFDYIIGLGQGGSRIAASFRAYFGFPAVYFNFSKVDFSKFKGVGSKYVLSDGGTGRDPGVGEELAFRYEKEIGKVLISDMKDCKVKNKEAVLVCVGGGGGSGCGLLKVVLPFVVNNFENVFLIYTLPEKKEKLPAKPNSLKVLNWIINDYMKGNRINVLLVDNEYSANKYSSKNFRFAGVNKELPEAFDKFFKITDLYTAFKELDFASGYNALDYRELKKVLFYSHGFLDIRSFSGDGNWLEMEEIELRKIIRTSSSFVGSFDINTAKISLCCVSLPSSYREREGISDLVDNIFHIVGRLTRSPIVFNCSYYDIKLKNIVVNIMLGGLVKSKSLNSLINQAIKDRELLENKEEIISLDLSGI